MDYATAMKIRAKKLGVLIKDARMAKGKSLPECASNLGITVEQFEAIELGKQAPSLPQLEVLAYYLDIPMDHFWGSQTLTNETSPTDRLDLDQLYSLRQRMIGTTLRQARQNAGFTPEAIEASTGVTARDLNRYESGRQALPLTILETLCQTLDISLKGFQDKRGPVGVWEHEQRAVKDFLDLSPDLQEFVSRPVNRPYLELAQRLSEMSVDRLRAVAEGLLEITL